MNLSSTSAAPASGIILTPIDVDRLLNDGSADSRASVLEKISKSYNDNLLQGRTREIAEQIFRLLMKDAALRVRETLAERIKDNPGIPRDVALHLANDVDAVALPILKHSAVLSDADLVGIVEKSSDMNKLLAISKRETVSSRVSDALVETRYAEVMTSLLSNTGASIGERALTKISDDFRNDVAVMNALVNKEGLPIAVVEKIISQASAAVAAQLKDKYQLSDTDLKKDTSAGREDLMLQLLEQDMSQEEIEVLVAQMAKEERLTPSVVMTSLCRGQLLFFTVAMAQFAGVSATNARKLLSDRGVHGFNGLYDKSGFPESMQEAIRLLLRTVQGMEGDAIPGSMLYANRLVEQVIAASGEQQIEYLPYFIALIRQNIYRG